MDSSVTINLLIRTLGRRERSVFVGRATLDTNTWPRPHACNRSARPDYRRSRSTTSFPSIPPSNYPLCFRDKQRDRGQQIFLGYRALRYCFLILSCERFSFSVVELQAAQLSCKIDWESKKASSIEVGDVRTGNGSCGDTCRETQCECLFRSKNRIEKKR